MLEFFIRILECFMCKDLICYSLFFLCMCLVGGVPFDSDQWINRNWCSVGSGIADSEVG